jgi:hypothetical protein
VVSTALVHQACVPPCLWCSQMHVACSTIGVHGCMLQHRTVPAKPKCHHAVYVLVNGIQADQIPLLPSWDSSLCQLMSRCTCGTW